MDMLRAVEPTDLIEAVASLGAQEQAGLLQAVMQRKFDKILQPQTVELPEIELVAS